MSALITNRFWPALAAVAAMALVEFPIVSAWAGEPIRFGGEKIKSTPDSQSIVPKDRFRPTDRIPAVTPFDAINSSGANLNTRRLDPKEEKRLKNAKLEKENWAVVNRGELQEQDDQETEFGIRDYSGDSLEKEEKGAGAIWFGSHQDRAGKSTGQSRAPVGSLRAASLNRTPAVPRADTEVSYEAATSSGFDAGARPGQGQGKEVSFQNLAPASDANNVLKDLFNMGPAGTRVVNEPSRGRDDFGLRSITAQPEPGSPGLSRGFGLGNDLGRPSAASSPSLIERPGNQSGAIGSGIGSSRLNSAFDSPRYDLNNAARSSVSPLAPARNDYAPSSTRNLFTPPPRPGSLESR
jgi:hypothetical protein